MWRRLLTFEAQSDVTIPTKKRDSSQPIFTDAEISFARGLVTEEASALPFDLPVTVEKLETSLTGLIPWYLAKLR